MLKERKHKNKDIVILALNDVIDPIFYTTKKYFVKDILYEEGIYDYLNKEKNNVKKLILSEELEGINDLINTVYSIRSYVNSNNINMELYILLKEKNLPLMSKLKELGVYKIFIATPRSLVNILADIFEDPNIQRELDKEMENRIKEIVFEMKAT